MQDFAEGFPRFVSIPKKRGGSRLLTVLGARDDGIYRRLAGRVTSIIDARLDRAVFPRRAAASGSAPGLKVARTEFRRMANRLAARRETHVVAHTDVRDCFANISPAAVEWALVRLGCPRPDAIALRSFLEYLAERGVCGLPVGPASSQILADAVLSAADEAVAGTAGISHMRWVDDFYIFAAGDHRAEAALSAAQDALGLTGLRIAPEKTGLLHPGDEIVEFACSFAPRGPIESTR